ncbi:MAG: ABC transporter substrate-binding protein [Gaiella sp.]
MSRPLALAAILVCLPLLVAPSALGSAAASAPGAFPVTVRAANGAVTVAKRPVRIVSLSPTATETLFAIGAGRQVVAVDDQSDYPKTAPRTSLSGFTPNVEAIAAYRPDLVVISYDPKGLSSALRTLGITVLHHNAAATLKGAYQQIRQLGAVTGRGAQADRLVSRMQARIARTVERAKRAGPRSLFVELDPTLYSATSSTFIGRVASLFGLRNIADAAEAGSGGYPQLSAEYVIAANPDVILLADTRCCGQSAKTVAARPGWSGIEAVRTGSVIRLDDSIASRWGPRLVDLVRALGTALARLGGR